jgi:hypothetical protein
MDLALLTYHDDSSHYWARRATQLRTAYEGRPHFAQPTSFFEKQADAPLAPAIVLLIRCVGVMASP